MKKLILAATLAASVTFSASAAKITKGDDDSKIVSYFVLNQFNSDFNGAQDVVWTITPTSQKADFTIDGTKKTAFYSLTGTYLGVTQEVAYKTVPTAAQKDITEEYAGYTVGQVIKFQASEDNSSSFYRTLAVDAPETTDYFVDLKKGDSEVLVRVNERGSVYFFKQVK